MANFARRIVSGNKARFRDEELGLELDLVYVTDNVIIMGYPADGMEAFYRNSRHDAKKFLEHRHQQNYWIFNFCPLTENSYPADFFRGHVSRYPFPDHHAPPLAIMALASREIVLWLDKSKDNVVVLHCKAGKGRSGTLACSYLLTLEAVPNGPQLERSHTRKEWANKRAAEMMAAVTSVSEPEATEEQIEEEESAPPPDSAKPIVGTTLDPTDEGITPIGEQNGPDKNTIGPGDTVRIEKDALSPSSSTPSISGPQADELGGGDSLKEDHPVVSLPNFSATNSTSSLDSVLALHSARRMKPLVKKDTQKAAPKGVSIPSQRRFLFYWSQILSGASPRGLWDIPSSSTASKPQKVRLIGVTVRLLEPGTTKQTAVRIISNILSRTKNGKGKIQSASGDLWISLARYDDQLVETLESWEKHTRDPKSMGRRRPGSETMHDPIAADGEQGIAKLFDDGRWDNGKMVRSFARLGSLADSDVFASREGGERIVTHCLHPLTESNWIDLKKKTKQSPKAQAETTENTEVVTDDSISTISDREGQVTAEEIEDAKILLDANREVRAKLYLGSVPMGWFWFVPTFHMKSNEVNPVHLNLPKSAIDFPLGPGSWIVDVDVEMEWAKSDSN